MLLMVAHITGELVGGIVYCYEHPMAYLWMLGIILTAYVGLRFVLGLIKVYGSFVAMTVTSCRKVVSISLSFILFPKPLTVHFIVASILVSCGIFLHIYTKNYKDINRCFSVSKNILKEIDGKSSQPV